MRRQVALLGVPLVLIVVACGVRLAPPTNTAPGGQGQTTTPPPTTPPKVTPPAKKPADAPQEKVPVFSAKQIAELFAADWKAAFLKFPGTKLQIEGVVSEIRTWEKHKVNSILFVVPNADPKKPEAKAFTVHCNFTNVPKAEVDKMASVKVGQSVKICGSLTGPGEAHAIFNFCVLVSEDAPPKQ